MLFILILLTNAIEIPGGKMTKEIFGIIKSLLIIFLVSIFQYNLWDLIYPSRWFLFYPAVFISCFIGGKYGGYVATIASAMSVSTFFIPSEGFLIFAKLKDWFSVAVFTITGFAFNYFAGRFRDLEFAFNERILELTNSEKQNHNLLENMAIDIKQRKEAEIALNKERLLLNRITEASPIGIVTEK